MKLIKSIPKYYEHIRILRNNPKVKSGFIVQKNITKKEQLKYMEKYHNDYWVCLLGGVFVGYIGIINNDIRICVDPKFQNLGVGAFMLKRIKCLYPKAQAKIMINNVKSLHLFVNMGYKIKFYLLEL